MHVSVARNPTVLGVVYSLETLAAALNLPELPAPPDWLELRVDAFTGNPGRLDEIVRLSPRPLLVTVRHPDEGGLDPVLTAALRAALYERFLPAAAAVDIEVRSLDDLSDVCHQARSAKCKVIASFHDFQGTPDLTRLQTIVAKAAAAGADICKVATTLCTPGDLATLLSLLDQTSDLPMSVMGMGPLGRASRPVLAAAGSVLNYGFLGETAQVPGQWPVVELRARIDELIGE